MEHNILELLKLIDQNPNLDPKNLAEKFNITVGKIKHMLSKLINQKNIYIEKNNEYIKYHLTLKGSNFIKDGIPSFHEKEIKTLGKSLSKITQAVILAAGQRKDFDKPAGLMCIDNITLLKRNIDILHQNGINHIVIITGYKQEAFNGMSEYSEVLFVNNSKYKWTGSMASLALAHQYITDDFLLIEDDILIEERAIKEIISHPQRDCVLITNESGSGDEAFVEIKNGYLHKISKDIHQFNRVDGEMIGISKLSYEIFTQMVNEFQYSNNNPYMNYEYMLLDISRKSNIGYLNMFNLVWGEIDNKYQYEIVKNDIYPILKRKEVNFEEKQIGSYLVDALKIDYNDIRYILPFGGMTNKNFKVKVKDKDYVLRIPGNGTEKIINRRDEKFNSILASDLGIDTNLVYFNEKTGVKIAELIQNAETLNSKTSKRHDNMKLTAAIFRKLHNSNKKMVNQFNVFKKINEYEFLLREEKCHPYEYFYEVKDQVLALKGVYLDMNIELTPCHNDPVPENFVKDTHSKIYLIDWEYGGMNDPMWDIAAYSLECDFSSDDENLFLSLYLNQNNISLEIKQRVLMNKIFQDFLWSIWTIIKEAKGDDFGSYGINRFARCRKHLNHELIKELNYALKI